MATVSDINNTERSNLNHIDALLDSGPDWNYLTGNPTNTIQYTFSVTTGNESGRIGQEAFTLAQQGWVRTAFNELSRITGIVFTETSIGSSAQIHLCNINLDNASTTGLCSWQTSYAYTMDQQISSYDADAYVYLDNVEWYAANRDLTPGGQGYETLLHELGHALGLKHPFDDSIHLPAAQDNTNNTLMSYTDAGGNHSTYSQYDVAALNWLYGGDGLRGALGINSTTGGRYFTGTTGADALTGTNYNDTLQGDGGNDMINGGFGTDTVVFRGARSLYAITQNADGSLVVSGADDGTDTLQQIEVLQFSDGRVERAQLGDTTPPAAPTITVPKNANGYAISNAPVVNGAAEANSTVTVYSGSTAIGSVHVDASGVWSLNTTAFADGLNYTLYAKATDAAGNVSAASSTVSFNIDAHAPSVPTLAASLPAGSNQPSFSGSGEVGTMIQLVRIGDGVEIGRTVVAADGTWQVASNPVPNGDYLVGVSSVDLADNATSGASRVSFTVNNSLNLTGTSGKDAFVATAGNAAIDGGGGADTISYNGARSNFTLHRDVYGFSVKDNSGTYGNDSLYNVERIKFADTSIALDIDGNAGLAYRLYQAAFDRAPDKGGLGYWTEMLDSGRLSHNEVAYYFSISPEFMNTYGQTSNSQFISLLYNNVLDRAPEGGGFAYWLDIMDNNRLTRQEVLAFFSESPENQANVIGTIQNGMEYTPYG